MPADKRSARNRPAPVCTCGQPCPGDPLATANSCALHGDLEWRWPPDPIYLQEQIDDLRTQNRVMREEIDKREILMDENYVTLAKLFTHLQDKIVEIRDSRFSARLRRMTRAALKRLDKLLETPAR